MSAYITVIPKPNKDPANFTSYRLISLLNLDVKIKVARVQKIEDLLLSIDMKKVFDRVAWDFMLETCKFIGLGTHIMSWISVLYNNPSAKLRINRSLSDTVNITNGTRQGCPLSILLFILSLEPFNRRVVAEGTIKGFQMANREFKVAAYADDLLLFLTKPHTHPAEGIFLILIYIYPI